jgi:metallo-beta-lactamase class B
MGLKAGLAAGLACLGLSGCATIYSTFMRDNLPFEPFEIAPGLYYVGASDIAVFAIESGGEIALIDGGYETTAGQVLANMETLCAKTYKLCRDTQKVKYIFNTHAHMDHAAGIAALQKATGAEVVASTASATQLRAGGANDFALGSVVTYPNVENVKEIADGDSLPLGAMSITAHLTPGHTKGCTSWSFKVQVHGREATALVNCSLTVLPGYDLKGYRDYPHIAADFAMSFDKLRALPCDLPLGAHGKFFHLKEKRELQKKEPRPNPFVSREAGTGTCKDYLDEEQAEFRSRLNGYVPKAMRPPGY